MAEVKKRKILSRDWDTVEKFVKDELEKRKSAKYRQDAEKRWAEVDRQLKMDEMKRLDHTGKAIKWTWHNAMELGELAKAHEIITADVMRIMFPQDRAWFTTHVELQGGLGPNGRAVVSNKKQKIADGLLRNLMAQQHKDFGFKDRFRLSVKESLAHGSFVAQVVWHSELMVKDNGSVRKVAAPIWKPYSMWNSYPDPSMSVIGGELFYPGSMIVTEYMPWGKFKSIAKGDGWMADRVGKVEKAHFDKKKSEGDDVEIATYEGDAWIDRKDGDDIYLPNVILKLVNGKLCYYQQNPLPYSSFIYGGYERQDVRHPLYTSPIIKNSPLQKAATIVMNKFLDWVALQVEPPVEYDGNDPDYVGTDGPMIAPGAKNPRKGGGKAFEALKIGSGQEALTAIQLFARQFQEGLGVSSIRAGGDAPDRQTATEASLANQGSEVRTMEFIDQLGGKLVPFLYIQHQLNRDNLTEYAFYNDEMSTPDFIRADKSQIQANAVFEYVGSKGILGERERATKVAQTVAFLSGNPLFAPKLKPTEIALGMLQDAGKKNAEEWIEINEKQDPRIAQAQQLIQALQGELKKLQEDKSAEMAKINADYQAKILKLQMEKDQAERDRVIKEHEIRIKQFSAETDAKEVAINALLENAKMQIDDAATRATQKIEIVRLAHEANTDSEDMNESAT